ncbi:ABC-2 family transporter protein [Salinarimonas chemoclinalis]|uniref:ABC-2 family transporter protein n=1 Tax=Salinarimonas chemoclinalis TaxID=3241599 RepID=UPI00355738FD
MRSLLALLRIEAAASLADRRLAVLGAMHKLLLAGAQVLLWSSLVGPEGTTIDGGHLSHADVVTYVLLATALASLAEFPVVDTINDRVARGQAAVDVLRPPGFPMLVLAGELARFVVGLVTQALPALVVLGAVLGFVTPGPDRVAAALLLVVGGWLLATLVGWCIAIAALRLLDTTQVKYAFQGVTALFSGALVPLWFFPEPLRAIAEALPFHLLFHAPLSVWLGLAGWAEIVRFFAVLALWLCVLVPVAVAAWHWSRAEMVVHGG